MQQVNGIDTQEDYDALNDEIVRLELGQLMGEDNTEALERLYRELRSMLGEEQ